MMRILFGHSPEKNQFNELAQTLLRVFFGLNLALAHGLAKMPPSEKFIASVAAIGFPAPTLFSYLAGISECIGGILLALGLLSRPAALMIMCTMATAAFGRHAADAYNIKELALIYFIVAFTFVVRGASSFSIDRLIGARLFKARAPEVSRPQPKLARRRERPARPTQPHLQH